MTFAPAKMNPFPGLRPFTQEEDYLFFGREEQTLELLQRLGGNRFVAVVGTSGSGKSSLVRCGLLSELLGGKMLGAGACWDIAVTHPGGNPLALLTDALLEADLYDREAEHARENLLATLSRSHFGLVEAVKQADLGEGTNFLLVVDQFEEVFRFHEAGQRQQEAANEFVSLLLQAAAQKDVPIYVVLTMRSDFIGECGQFEGLAEMVNRGEFLIPRLNREQYKRVIEGPIKVAGGQIAPRLLQRLLNDLGQQADQLPCLQHALMRTWDVWASKGDSEALDLDDYQCVGRMSQALSLHADEIYESLASDRQRELCRGIFQALTIEESNSRGIRRPQRLGRLCQILEVPADELRPIIDAYRRSGVTFLMPSPEVELTEQTIVDISHESLMRVWTRLRQWVEEETQAAGIYHRLSESADLHAQGKAGLYRDPELGIALSWQEAKRPNAAWAERYRPGFETAIGFLAASQRASVAEEELREAARQRELEQAQQLAEARQLRLEQQQRTARKLRKLMAGVAGVAVIAGVACVFALVANNKANQETSKARKSATDAELAQRDTKKALEALAVQKAAVDASLKKAEEAERLARNAEKQSRELRYVTDMELAGVLIEHQNATARQILDRLANHDPTDPGRSELKGQDDLRGFEWNYLRRLVDSRGTIFTDGGQAVAENVLTAEGALRSLDWGSRSQLRDVQTRQELHPPLNLEHGREVNAQALSADGRLIALAIADKVHLVDSTTGKDTMAPLSGSGRLGMVFSPDQRMLVTLSQQIGWWDLATGTLIASADSSSPFASSSVSLSADGLTAAVAVTGGNSFSTYRMNPATRQASVLVNEKEYYGGLRTLATSPDGQYVAVTHYFDGRIVLYETATGREVTSNRSAHSGSITALAFNPDGTQLVTASSDGALKVWKDFKQLESPETGLMGHTAEVTAVAFAQGGKRVISSSRDKTTRIWDLEQRVASLRRKVEGLDSYRAQISPDGLLFAAADRSQNRIRLWDATTGRLVRSFPRQGEGVFYSVAFSPDGRLLAAGFGGKTGVSYIELWDIDREERLAVLPGTTDLPNFTTTADGGLVSTLAFSPDGKHLVAGFGSLFNLSAGNAGNHPLKVYDVATRRAVRHLKGHVNACPSLKFSRDGSRLATASYDGTARIWDTATWKERHVLPNPDAGTAVGQKRVLDVDFSPDGKFLAMASHEGHVIIWDATTGQQLQILRGHSNGVPAVAFSPDGRTLASGSADQTIRLWNTATWGEMLRLDAGMGNFQESSSLSFSPDGSQLLAGCEFAVFWSALPANRTSAEQTAAQLGLLLQSGASLPSRIRMISENLQLHEGLELLARGRPNDVRLLPALAATRANWHASRQEWKRAVEQFDRLQKLSPDAPDAWLRTPGLLRLAAALVHENRPAEAAALLTGGAGRRAHDGLGPVSTVAEVGLVDDATGDLLRHLRTVVDEKLVQEPRHAALLEVRAELASQWSDTQAQLADYTAAIEVLSQQPPETTAADLERVYGRRGRAYVALQQWPQAVDDFARAKTEASQDEELLATQALALAGVELPPATWTVLKPVEAKSDLGATLSVLPDDSILAGGTNPLNDRYRVVSTIGTDFDLTAVRLEALTDNSLPAKGPGRHPTGTFAQISWTVTATPPAGKDPIRLDFRNAWTDQPLQWPIETNGHLNAFGGRKGDHVAFWSVSRSVPLPVGTTLTFEMQFKSAGANSENLGRFRLSVSNDPAALDRERTYATVTTLTDPWQKLAAAYRFQNNQAAINELVERRPQLAARIGDLFIREKPEDWSRAVEIYSRGINARMADAVLLSKRARASEALQDWEAATADWSRFATGNRDAANVHAEFAKRLAAAGQNALANREFEQAQALYEQAIEAEPENDSAAVELAQLLLNQQEFTSAADWTVLQPTEMTSTKGATLTRQDDGSILASGSNNEGEIYKISAPGPVDRIAAVRLEALPDASLPRQGPGRHPTGNFHLHAFRLSQSPGPGESGLKPLLVGRVRASFDYKAQNADVAGTIDESLKKMWHVWGRMGEAHQAYFFLREPAAGKDRQFVIELRNGANLGRFRLSVCANSAEWERLATIARVSDPWLRLAAAYAVSGRQEPALRYFVQALEQAGSAEARKPILEIATLFDELFPVLVQRLPDDPQLRMFLARHLIARGKSLLTAEKPAEALAELKQAQEIYRRQFPAGENWTVIRPLAMRTETGAELKLQSDGSVFAQDPVRNGIYTLEFQTNLKGIRGLRIEALADSRLPSGGPGWFGNFLLTGLTLQAAPAASPDQPRSIRLQNPVADFSQVTSGGWSVQGAVDGDDRSGWGIWPEANQNHEAVFETAEGIGDGSPLRLMVELKHQSTYEKHQLGRFRVSVSNDMQTLQATRTRLNVNDSHLADLNSALASALVGMAGLHAQQGRIQEAVASITEALELDSDRAAIARIVAQAAALPGVLEKLAERTAGQRQLQVELARLFAARGQTSLADAARQRARALLEQQLSAEPDQADAARELADLLLLDTSGWTSLKPVEMSGQGGEILTAAEDDTVFVEGPAPDRGVYTLTFRPSRPIIAAIRLETIPDTRLPAGGAGRSSGGNFHLGEFAAAVESGNADGQWTPLVISRMLTDDPDTTPHRRSIDGDPRTTWDTYPRIKDVHWAVFGVESPARIDGRAVRITLDSGITDWPKHGLGRFRLWVSDDPAAIERELKRFAVTRLTDPWARLAAAYHDIGDQAAFDRVVARHPTATAGLGDLYAASQDWERALAEYNKAITPETRDAWIFAARAQAHEKLEHWELAAADWVAADLHATDKRARYGNPYNLCLEHLARVHGRLQQYDKQVVDYTELLKPERFGDSAWMFALRGEAYERMRQWDQARADYESAVRVAVPNERASFQMYRTRYFAALGQWQEAAEDLRQIYQKPEDFVDGAPPRKDWWLLRDATVIFAMAGDMENCRRAAAACFRQHAAGDPHLDDNRWTVLTQLLLPDMITGETRARLLEIAGKTDPYWQPRLTAAIHFRSGEPQPAAQLFVANGGGPQFQFLAALLYQQSGEQVRAKQLLEEGNAWVREQGAQDPAAGIPPAVGWREWAPVVTLQDEALELVLGSAVGAPKRLAIRGYTARAAEAYAKAVAEAVDPDTKAPIIEELAQFEGLLTAVHRLLPDDQPLQAAYRGMVDRTAAEYNRQLDGLTGESSEASRAQLLSVIIRRQDDVPDALRKLRPDDALLHAAHSILRNDWKTAAANYAQRIERDEMAPSPAWMPHVGLWVYAGDTARHRESCQRMYERFRDTQLANDAERVVKMMLLVADGPELPPAALQRFQESFDTLSNHDRAWFLCTRALLECRRGNHAEAQKAIDAALALEQAAPLQDIRALALAVRALDYALQKDVARGREALDQMKQVLSRDLKLSWKPDGQIDGSTILNGVSVAHDALIPEILRRETEQLLESEAGPPNQ